MFNFQPEYIIFLCPICKDTVKVKIPCIELPNLIHQHIDECGKIVYVQMVQLDLNKIKG